MPHDEDFHTRLTRTEEAVRSFGDRHNTLEKRYLDDIHRISSALGAFQAIADEFKALRPVISKIEALDSRMTAIEDERKGVRSWYKDWLFWVVTSGIILAAKFGHIVTDATLNNR